MINASDGDQNLHESSVNVISHFTICWKREIRKRQFSLFFMILSGKIAKCCVISREIGRIMGIGCEKDFAI